MRSGKQRKTTADESRAYGQTIESLYEQFRLPDSDTNAPAGVDEVVLHFVQCGWNLSELPPGEHGLLVEHAIHAFERAEDMLRDREAIRALLEDIAARKRKAVGTTGKALWSMAFASTAPAGRRVAKLSVVEIAAFTRYLHGKQVEIGMGNSSPGLPGEPD